LTNRQDISEDCENRECTCEESGHEFESYGTIDTETDYKGIKDLVGYECIYCKKSFEEWTYRN